MRGRWLVVVRSVTHTELVELYLDVVIRSSLTFFSCGARVASSSCACDVILQSPIEFSYYNRLLELTDVRKAIHVGNVTYNSGVAVEKHLIGDVMQSVAPWLAETMNYYKVRAVCSSRCGH